MIRFLLIATLFIQLSIHFSYAQTQQGIQSQYHFRHITVDQGLTNNNVRSICQDFNGFIWMATPNGVDKFDGHTIKSYSHDPNNSSTISSNSLNSIYLDSKNNLWFCTYGGLDLYNLNSDNFIRFSHEDIKNEMGIVYDIVEDKDEKLWIGASSGLYVYNLNTLEIKHLSNEQNNPYGLPPNEIFRLLVDRNNNVWISVIDEGLCVYNQKNENLTCFKHDPDNSRSISGNRIERIYEDTKGNIWAGTFNNGLNRYIPEDNSFLRFIPDSSNSYSTRVRAIFEDLNGNLFIGTRGGLYILDNQTNGFIHYAYEGHDFSNLSQNSILCSFIDNSGSLWIGTFSGGVNYTDLKKKQFIHYKAGKDNNNFLYGATVFAIAEDPNGNLWLGGDNGLNFLDRSTHTFKHFLNDPNNPYSISFNDIKVLEYDKKGDLWIGTNKGGLNYYNAETERFMCYKHDPNNSNSLSSDKVYGLMNDMDNNLWVLTNSNIDNQYSTIDILPNGSDKFIHLSEKAFRGFAQNEKGDVFIGGINGFWIFNRKDSIYNFISNDTIIDKVNVIKQDSKGRIWVGSKKGLVRYNLISKTFVQFSKVNGFPVSEVFGILEDEAKNLWVSSDVGLLKFTNIVESIASFKIKVFDKEDGLQSKQFNYNAYLKCKSGEMVFGGINGFNTFYPDQIVDNLVPPNVMLTDLKIFSNSVQIGQKVEGRLILKKSISSTDEIMLGSRQNIFTIEFAALHYANPERNTFKYMLEGFDTEWQIRKAGNNYATYSNLPAGKYIFIVTAANTDGVWNESNPVRLEIQIIPPFYKRKLFILLVLILIALGVYYAFKAREKQLKADKKVLEDSLNEGKEKLKKQQEEILKQQEEIKLRDEQEKEIRWYNTGLAKFSDVLSQSKEDLTSLTQSIITNLVEYLDADLGAIFLLNDNDPDNLQLDFTAGYAYSNETNRLKVFRSGEGYVGTCFKDKATIVLEDMPENYLKIVSGLGEIAPSSIALVPMKLDERVSGVIEIASFRKIDKYKIEFIEKIAETVTSNIAIIKSEQKAKFAVEDAKQNSEELQAADEELRQNLEEMEAIQEELSRKQNALLTEQAMFQTLMNFLEDRITFKDPESIYLRVNKVKSDGLKLKDANDAIGKSDKHFFGEEHFNRAYEDERKIFNKGIPIINQEELLRFKDGSVKWGATSRIPFKSDDGNAAGTLIITKDISKIKYLESKNKANSNILEDLSKEYPILMFSIDINNIISNISGNGLNLLNMEKRNIEGKSFYKVFKLSEKDVPKSSMDKILKTELKTKSSVLSIHHKLVYNEYSEGYECCSVISEEA